MAYLQDVFDWRLVMTGPDGLVYQGNYHGVEVGLLLQTLGRGVGTVACFVRVGPHNRCDGRFDTAEKLLASFPSLSPA